MEQSKQAKSSDRADCTVKALALVASIPYEQAFQIAAAAGRRPAQTMKSSALIAYLKKANEQGIQFRKVRGKAKSIYRFCQEHPTGRFFCRRIGHAFAVIDGAYHNERQGDRTMVLDAWELVDAKPASDVDKLLALCPISMMDGACELDTSYRRIQGLALTLIRQGRAKWFRRRLVATTKEHA